MRRSILVVPILAVGMVVFAPSASAMTVDILTLKPVETKVKKEKPKKHIANTSKMVVPAIPVVIEYIAVPGDTLSKIAENHQTTVQRLWQKNTNLTNPDLLNIGDKLIIPTASEVLADRPFPVAATPSVAPASKRAAISGNAYAPGNCTEYIKNMRPEIGNFWGDASNWYYAAQADGFAVGSTPASGAIGVAISYGHVVYVHSVSGNMVNISEQNYEGLGIVSYRTAPASEFRYIY